MRDPALVFTRGIFDRRTGFFRGGKKKTLKRKKFRGFWCGFNPGGFEEPLAGRGCTEENRFWQKLLLITEPAALTDLPDAQRDALEKDFILLSSQTLFFSSREEIFFGILQLPAFVQKAGGKKKILSE